MECFHCDEEITYRGVYYIMSRYVPTGLHVDKYFHEGCFLEIAGQDYVDNLTHKPKPNKNNDTFSPVDVGRYKSVTYDKEYKKWKNERDKSYEYKTSYAGTRSDIESTRYDVCRLCRSTYGLVKSDGYCDRCHADIIDKGLNR